MMPIKLASFVNLYMCIDVYKLIIVMEQIYNFNIFIYRLKRQCTD